MSTPFSPNDFHPGWLDLIQRLQRNKLSRRAFIPSVAALAGGLALGLSPLGRLIAKRRRSSHAREVVDEA